MIRHALASLLGHRLARGGEAPGHMERIALRRGSYVTANEQGDVVLYEQADDGLYHPAGVITRQHVEEDQ